MSAQTDKHERQLIRAAVAAALTGKTDAGENVWPTRLIPLRAKDLPGIAIYTRNETSEEGQASPRELRRRCTVSIEAAAKAEAGIDDLLDRLARQIERQLDQDDTLGLECVSDFLLTATESDITGEGDQPLGVIRLDYLCTYYTGLPRPEDQDLRPFVGGAVKYPIEGQDQDDAAEDRLTAYETSGSGSAEAPAVVSSGAGEAGD